MKNSVAKVKVLVNILTGKIKVISMSDRTTCDFQNDFMPKNRLRNSLALLRAIESVRHSNVLSRATVQTIQSKIKAASSNN